LASTLLQHGIRTYSIFLHPETQQLFAYVEFADEAQWAAIARTDVCRRWWAHMRELMPSNPDHSPKSVDLREVFHLESMNR
jgi:L-rhamnose mutarotase